MNALLVTEYCEGELLSEVIREELHGDHGKLYYKLTAPHIFSSAFHNRTAIGMGIEFHQDGNYMDHLVDILSKSRRLEGTRHASCTGCATNGAISRGCGKTNWALSTGLWRISCS